MQPDEIKQKIEAEIADSEVTVKVDDGGHYWVTVVSESFAGQTPLNKERRVLCFLLESGGPSMLEILLCTRPPIPTNPFLKRVLNTHHKLEKPGALSRAMIFG